MYSKYKSWLTKLSNRHRFKFLSPNLPIFLVTCITKFFVDFFKLCWRNPITQNMKLKRPNCVLSLQLCTTLSISISLLLTLSLSLLLLLLSLSSTVYYDSLLLPSNFNNRTPSASTHLLKPNLIWHVMKFKYDNLFVKWVWSYYILPL